MCQGVVGEGYLKVVEIGEIERNRVCNRHRPADTMVEDEREGGNREMEQREETGEDKNKMEVTEGEGGMEHREI